MYIGTQFGCRHDTDIQVLAQLGVLHVDQTPAEPWTEWTADTLKALRDRFDLVGKSARYRPYTTAASPGIRTML